MRTSTLDDIGDLSAPPGSQAWAIAVRLHLQKKLKDRHDTENRLHEWCELLRQKQGWQVLTDRDGKPFPSWQAFCAYPPPEGLGETAEKIDEECKLRTHGGDRKSEQAKNQGAPSTLKRGSTSAAYLLARLDRDYPDLAARVRSLELRAKTAARLAGIIHEKTPLDQLRHWWRKADAVAQETFRSEIRKDSAA